MDFYKKIDPTIGAANQSKSIAVSMCFYERLVCKALTCTRKLYVKKKTNPLRNCLIPLDTFQAASMFTFQYWADDENLRQKKQAIK